MPQVSRDEVRIHRGTLAEDDFEEDDVDFVGKGFLGVLPRQEDGLFLSVPRIKAKARRFLCNMNVEINAKKRQIIYNGGGYVPLLCPNNLAFQLAE